MKSKTFVTITKFGFKAWFGSDSLCWFSDTFARCWKNLCCALSLVFVLSRTIWHERNSPKRSLVSEKSGELLAVRVNDDICADESEESVIIYWTTYQDYLPNYLPRKSITTWHGKLNFLNLLVLLMKCCQTAQQKKKHCAYHLNYALKFLTSLAEQDIYF